MYQANRRSGPPIYPNGGTFGSTPSNSGVNNFTQPHTGANQFPGTTNPAGYLQPQNPPGQPAGNRVPNGQNQPQAPPPSTHSAYNPPHDPCPDDSATVSDDHINGQIDKINGKDKLVEFIENLVVADEKDYAHVHGVGGAKHARNSTISVNICDYSRSAKPDGKKSITVGCPVDVFEFHELRVAAMDAARGRLLPPWWNPQPNPGDPWYSFVREKNHGAYAKSKDGFAPVKRIEIHYTPVRKDGVISNYPWYIGISTFDAPVSERGNGAIVHQSKQAKNLKEAFIMVSTKDFETAMVRVVEFVRLWESVHAAPVIASGSKKMREKKEAMREARKNGNA